MLFEVKDVDKRFYEDHLADFLPLKMVDIHTHTWLDRFVRPEVRQSRGAAWPSLVARDDSIEDLLETYKLMFPRQQVTPQIFGLPSTSVILDQTNEYVTDVAQQYHLPSLIVSIPEWSGQEIERRVLDGGFLGLKPYLAFAPSHL